MRWSRSRHAGDGFGSLVTGGGKAVKWLCKRPPREVLSYPPIWYRRTSNVNVNVVLVIELPFRNEEKREFMHLRQEKIRDSDKTSGSTFGWHNYTILNFDYYPTWLPVCIQPFVLISLCYLLIKSHVCYTIADGYAGGWLLTANVRLIIHFLLL